LLDPEVGEVGRVGLQDAEDLGDVLVRHIATSRQLGSMLSFSKFFFFAKKMAKKHFALALAWRRGQHTYVPTYMVLSSTPLEIGVLDHESNAGSLKTFGI
jgi:hypothetical protein